MVLISIIDHLYHIKVGFVHKISEPKWNGRKCAVCVSCKAFCYQHLDLPSALAIILTSAALSDSHKNPAHGPKNLLYLFIYLFILFISLFIYLLFYLFTYLFISFIYFLIYLFTYLFILLFIYLFIYLFPIFIYFIYFLIYLIN